MPHGILPQLQRLRLLPIAHQGCASSSAGHPSAALDNFEVFPRLIGLAPSSFHSIASLSRLEVLNLKNCVDVDDEAVECLISVPTLRVLNLSGADVTDDGMFWRQHIRSLKRVDISNCRAISSAGVEQLTNLPDLTHLHMRGMKPLECSSLGKMKRLASISLRDCGWVKDETLEDLAQCRTLQSVCLRNCHQTTDNVLKMLCRLPLLRSVHLRGCTRITDVGLNCLGASPHLEDVDLSLLCRITDARLACLTHMTKLRRLILNWCSSVTAAGLRTLQTACREVKELSIKGCNKVQLSDLSRCPKGIVWRSWTTSTVSVRCTRENGRGKCLCCIASILLAVLWNLIGPTQYDRQMCSVCREPHGISLWHCLPPSFANTIRLDDLISIELAGSSGRALFLFSRSFCSMFCRDT